MTRIVFFYNAGSDNPYMTLLTGALRRAGYDVACVEGCSPWWLWKNRNLVDILHFQWVQYFYVGGHSWSSTLWALIFLAKLFLARWMGFKLVWTVHNLMPHERSPGLGDRIAHGGLAFLADEIVVHCHAAAALLQKTFVTRGRIHVIPHGHYAGWYHENTSRSEARAYFNIPESEYVYLYFGSIRPYKGLERLIRTFRTLPAGSLVIAGKPSDSRAEGKIRKWCRDDPRISLHLSFIPDAQVPCLFECCDSVVLPFSDVLTSGSAILALSLGRPVIAPSLGCLPELVSGRLGLLFDPESPSGLENSMTEIRHRHYSSEEIKSHMREHYDWRDIAKCYGALYGRKARSH